MVSRVRSRRGRALALGLLLVTMSAAAVAARVRSLDVSEQDGVYRVNLEAWLDVTPSAAFAVLTDYPHLKRINASIRSVRVLAVQPSGATHIATEVHMCIWFFCKTLKQVQVTSVIGPDVLHARIVPGESDFRFGEATWRLTSCDGGACLRFDARLEPAFWVPPLIGPWIIRHKLESEAAQTARGMERAARSLADQRR